MKMLVTNRNILALDVGNVRVGLAIADTSVRISTPLRTLTRGNDFWEQLIQILKNNDIDDIVIGLPRSLNGNDTPQTMTTIQFAKTLKRYTSVPIHFQDEALTSKKAEEELRLKNKPYTKEAVDALAATYILEDYLQEAT